MIRKIFTALCMAFLAMTYSHADKLPPKSEGTANGILIVAREGRGGSFVLDFQKSKASWGYECSSCHMEIICSTTSGKSTFGHLYGKERTFGIGLPNGKYPTDYYSDIELGPEWYSRDKIYDGATVCFIFRFHKRIRLVNRSDKKDVLYIEPRSVLVMYFAKDYEKNFK